MFINMPRALLGTLIALNLAGCGTADESAQEAITTVSNVANPIWPQLDIEVKKDAVIEAQVAKMLSSMTLEQKIGQMIQPEMRDITLDDMRKYGFGSFLNGGGAYQIIINKQHHKTGLI